VRITTHDAVAGYWTLPEDGYSVEVPAKPPKMTYLPAERRAQILLGAMLARFRVEPIVDDQSNVTGARLRVDDHVICKLEKPTTATITEQCQWLRAYADLRDDRAHEIVLQIDDIVTTFSGVRPFDTKDREETAHLVDIVQDLAIFLEMQVKNYCFTPRPSEFGERLQPMIDTPDHSAFPSGHATESFAIAAFLARIEREEKPSTAIANGRQVFDVAHRIAVNRSVAGVHYPIDSASGAALGCAIGNAVAALATGTNLLRYDFDPNKPDMGSAAGSGTDFNRANMAEVVSSHKDEAPTISQVPLLGEVWSRAAAKWPNRGES
jgi:phage baseplate assembly protein W